MRPAAVVAAAIGLVVVLQPGLALAHAELEQAEPPSSVTLAAAPRQARLTFSEGVAASSRVVVSDGCGRVVSGTLSASGDHLVVPVDAGQPGGWRVDLDVVSADDGHESQDSYTFTVQGTRDCSGSPAAAAGSPALPVDDASTGTRTLVVAGLAAAVLVGVAVVVRRRTSG